MHAAMKLGRGSRAVACRRQPPHTAVSLVSRVAQESFKRWQTSPTTPLFPHIYDPKADELWEPKEREGQNERNVRIPDMRSDTVTKPTAEMIIAIMDAPVGDDVYGEDPTVNKLQTMAAERLEKEAALFVPTGTMGNLISIAVHAGRGDEVICGDEQHLFRYEQAGVSQLFGIGFHTLPNSEDGTFPLTYAGSASSTSAAAGASSPSAQWRAPAGSKRSLAYALESRHGGADAHYPRPAVLALENTHNRCGGAVLPQGWVDEAAAMAHAAGMKVHMDGARLYNAATAANVPVSRLVRDCDSVSLCLSKGLGAPLGSIIAGSADFIAKAHRLRKVLGGGMRQAGVAAACGIVGLKETSRILGADHARAKSLARGLAAIPGVKLDARKVATNIVFFDLDPSVLSVAALRARLSADAAAAAAAKAAGAEAPAPSAAQPSPDAPSIVSLSEVLSPAGAPDADDTSAAFAALVAHYSGGVRIGSYGGHRLRAVTHHQVRDDDIERCVDAAYKASEALRV